MRYILYARKSSEGDERQVQSIPDQYAVLQRLAGQLGLNIVETIDEARSAKQPGTRPGFQRMIEMVRAGQADGILCWHLNRLSRNPVDSGTLSWLLQQGTIQSIRTADREYRPDDNVVVMAVENAVSNQFVVDLRRNVQRGQREKALRGWFPHKPPPGYRTDPETREIVPDDERFELIRRAWELMLTGAYTVPQVQKRLEKWGFRHRRVGKVGRPINRSGLYALFDNPFYYGEFQYAGQRFQGKHRPMVTRQEFEAVQRTIHKLVPGSQRRPEYAYTGLIRCGRCGCLITAEQKVKHYRATKRTVTYTYYHCTRSKGCKEPAITEAFLDNHFTTMLKRIRLDPGLLEWIRSSAAELRHSSASDLEKAATQSTLELEKLAEKRSRLLELRLANEITAEEFAELNGSLKETISVHQERAKRLETALTSFESTIFAVVEFAQRALETFLVGSATAKREIIAALSRRAVLKAASLNVELHPVLATLLALEPLSTSADMVYPDPTMPLRPVWQGWLDETRNLVLEEGLTFPRVDCLRSDFMPAPRFEGKEEPRRLKRGRGFQASEHLPSM